MDLGTISSAGFQPTMTPEATSASSSSTGAQYMYIEPGHNGYVPYYACNANWNFDPQVQLAAFFMVLFLLSLIAHIIQSWYYKNFKLTWALLMGLTWETLGFMLRTGGALDQQNRGVATMHLILIMLAPLWINAFDYVVLGRMILVFLPEPRIFHIRGTWIAVIFVCLDAVAFLVQASAAWFLAPGNSVDQINTGMNLYMAGISLQQIYIVVFLGFVGRFHYRAIQLMNQRLVFRFRPWRASLIAIYISLMLITIRIVFRLHEFAGGLDPAKNPVPYHEWYFYIFDATPTWCCGVVMNLLHPGRATLAGPEGDGVKSSKTSKSQGLLEKFDIDKSKMTLSRIVA
ncbi:RTA1 like protein-domain-containing protein [Xylariales sp. AK1849]|nr:RTA1 like protein-domain-containing protein [Xylariales sp. AK1849]